MARPVGSKTLEWDDSFYLKCYSLARSGMAPKAMADALGVSLPRLRAWRAEKPALRQAIEEGLAAGANTGALVPEKKTFTDYVHDRLPVELEPIWERIMQIDKEPNFEKRVERMLAGQGKGTRQHLFVHALVANNFNATKASRAVGIAYTTFQNWVKEDPDFMEIMNQIHIAKKDFIEGGLMGLVGQGDTTAIIFASRTLNADRGYGTKTTVEHLGSIGHAIVDVDKLPADLRVQVLNTIRADKGQDKIPPRIVPAKVKAIGTVEKLIDPEIIDREDDDE